MRSDVVAPSLEVDSHLSGQPLDAGRGQRNMPCCLLQHIASFVPGVCVVSCLVPYLCSQVYLSYSTYIRYYEGDR